MKDPLAGKRQAINDGELDILTWPDDGTGAPVEQGQMFPLRSCVIEIGPVRRVKRGRAEWFWVATFTRLYRSQRVYLLAARGRRDYVHDDQGALSVGDQDRPDWEPIEGETVPQGPPPEAEAIPPREVKNLPTSVAARARFAEVVSEQNRIQAEQPLAVRLLRLQQLAHETHTDITSEERVIEKRIQALERRLLERRATAA